MKDLAMQNKFNSSLSFSVSELNCIILRSQYILFDLPSNWSYVQLPLLALFAMIHGHLHYFAINQFM